MMNITIKHIDDVIPHIVPDTGIIISNQSDYIIVDYVFTSEDTFNSSMALQCRGLKFDNEGRIIARPFHKFFNVGEKEQAHEIDWSQPHRVLDKLDGSLVHPAFVNGEMVFMTRKGITDHAVSAFSRADQNIMNVCRYFLNAGITPMFEYTAPDNRIVIAYEDISITLLAAREMISGVYIPHHELEKIALKFNVPIVGSIGEVDDFKSFINEARALEGIEGYVIAFGDGHYLKLKADAYVLRHKALASIAQEKNVLTWVAEKMVDDVIPLLSPEVAERVQVYEKSVLSGIEKRLEELQNFFDKHQHKDRKDFAASVMGEVDERLRGAAFAMLDGRDVREFLLDKLKHSATSSNKVDAVRDLYEFTWSTDGIAMPEIG